jgi:hypothetical protein
MSVTASATEFDALKRLTWATMNSSQFVSRCAFESIVGDEQMKLASPPFNVTRRDSNVINNGRIVASTRNIDDNNKQTALANSSSKVKATHIASPTCARTPLSNCTNQHCAFKLFLSATCYSSALDAEAFVPVMVERERAIAESDAKHFVVEFNFKCLTPAIRQCTVTVGCKLQIFHL